MEKGFIKRIIQATEDLDTSIYLNCSSFDEAMLSWLSDFSEALNSEAHLLERFDFKVTASSFLEKRLVQIHSEYLNKLTQYVDGVDLVFSRKALQYSKIAIKLNGPKDLTAEVLENVEDAKKYLTAFRASIVKVNNVSHKLVVYAKENKLLTLAGYEYQFSRIALFEKLTLDLAIESWGI